MNLYTSIIELKHVLMEIHSLQIEFHNSIYEDPHSI